MLAFGAVAITAGMIRDAHGTAIVTAFDMAAQTGGAAVQKVGCDFTMFRPYGRCGSSKGRLRFYDVPAIKDIRLYSH
jgi:hypothetical protein